MITLKRPELLENATLSFGSHRDGTATCARELLHLVVTGEHRDAIPECLSPCLSLLPPLNDGFWRDNDHRTATLLPYFKILVTLDRDKEKDEQRAYRLTDIAARVILPEAFDEIGLKSYSKKLRDLTPINDPASVHAVRYVLGLIRFSVGHIFCRGIYSQRVYTASNAFENVTRAVYAVPSNAYLTAKFVGLGALNAALVTYGFKDVNATPIERYSRLLLDSLCNEVTTH